MDNKSHSQALKLRDYITKHIKAKLMKLISVIEADKRDQV